MTKVTIRQNSWLAALAARRLGYKRVAFVLGKTIHLHNVTITDFINNKGWLMHELKHVDQFQAHGVIPFLWLYMKEFLRNGYLRNKYELEARAAEAEENLLKKYDISDYIKQPA